ncbi:MAG: (deoxy)nucleoside triphosphate pyrophosphohydrolase [Spirochaetales bacterium]|nr:(deoxy)nucleoside triphosphate pyrophosphohydrolase [Spirochaetales bacterium]
MKDVIVSGAAIMKGGRLFVAQRPAKGEAGLKWEFPGGKVEPGETPEQAVVREIREELDASITVRSKIAVINYTYTAFHLTMHLFLCTLDGPDPVIREHLAGRWITADELETLDWAPADYQVLGTVRRACFTT